METNQSPIHRLDRTVYELVYAPHPVRDLTCTDKARVEPQHVRWDGDRPYLITNEGEIDLKPLMGSDTPKFVVEKTRIIGLTPSEFQALDRGATAILGVARDGMEPITEGQELLALEGWNYPDEPRMDVRRKPLRVKGHPCLALVQNLTPEEIAAVTGHKVDPAMAREQIELHCAAIAAERRDGLDTRIGIWLIGVEDVK